MVIIKIYGGLGNQLFQYVLYEKFQSMGKETYADLNFMKELEAENLRFDQLGQIKNVKNGIKNLGIQMKPAKAADIARLADTGTGLAGRVRRKFCPSRKHVREGQQAGIFQPQILNLTDAYLEGYWQCEQYFKDIRNVILQKIQFKECNDVRNRKALEMLRSNDSVSVHVRRKDYASRDLSRIYGGICTAKYYKRAVSIILKKIENPQFIFFSDDIPWVRQKFGMKHAVYADWNYGENDYYDMYLMSQCRHNIIANSSFSWWGAWLNQNKDKTVIAPDRWTNGYHMADTVCQDWIRLDQTGQVKNEG